jgi:ubiquinone/menaquinone biosynthesis C-methylase UbiE
MGPSLTVLVIASALPGFAQQFGPAENLGPAIPTPQSIVERMLEAGRIKPGDVVYDLGSGDGRIVIAAALKYGVRAVGVEIMPDLCQKARERVRSEGLSERVRIIEGSALRVDLSPADVITMFFMTDSNERLRPALERQLRPGARVVSYQFPVHSWKINETVHVKLGKSDYPIFVYEIGKTK